MRCEGGFGEAKEGTWRSEKMRSKSNLRSERMRSEKAKNKK